MMNSRELRSPRNHFRLFMGQMLRRPGKIVAISPSSPGLARAMVREIGPDTGPVIELGSGTGTITREILDRGVPEDRLTMFEITEAFTDLLAESFPLARLMRVSATRVAECGTGQAGAVISGLPLLSMPTDVQREIVGGAFEAMRPGGIFVQFTYGYRPPVDAEIREELGLTWTRSHKIWANLPPARVYTFRKAA